MNEQLQQLIESALNKGGEILLWVEGEIPLVVQEILVFNLAKHSLIATFFLALTMCLFFFARKMWKEDWSDSSGDRAGKIIAGMVIFFVVGSVHLITALQIWLAPRLYLLEYAAKLVN